MLRSLAHVLAACTLAVAAFAQDPAPTPTAGLDLGLLADLKARAIGPAVVGGRIGAVAGIPGDPTTIWVGAASGGVWKSTDGGVRFTPMFDDQDVTSIGAIAIDPRNPDVVWIGTGEGNPRNSASVGRGVYRTRDGGRTWQKLGLPKSERIHRIVLHPTRSDTAWVAAMGTSWGENDERGVFRTRDGGASWEKVLFVDGKTGCADLAVDPRDPDKLFAAMWQHRRHPWHFHSGGPGSGLHRSLDGGSTWTKLGSDDGLPAGDLGRIGLAIAASDPNVVYALVEATKSVLLRSDDGGFRFRSVNSTEDIAPRPFYFCDVRVDPHDRNRVYNLHVVVDVSTDGGKSFGGLVGWDAAHPDHHALWIDPLDPRRQILGNDGGVYTSLDRGTSWRFCANLPLAQFYHVAVDDDVPYHVYGGLQDNGSWRGPSTVWENGGIRNLHWQEVCFGDGFATVPDPQDSRQGYAMSQGGSLVRYDLRLGIAKSIRPPAPEGTELRFNWNAAIALDPFAPGTVYYGSQFVHRSKDRGESWDVVSPDLTSDNRDWQKQYESGGLSRDVTAAENHCTVMTIAPSPVQQGVVWVGTDDGRVQVTQDGGQSWRSVEHRIPGLPANTWCPHVEAGKHAAGTAFAVFDGHRNTDWTPYVYVTRDFGATWVSLATPNLDGYCLVLEQDPVQPDLLWLGTEFGLWVTFDGGKQWQRWSHGVPACSAMALVTHPRTHDLVVATHGRSMFVLDDITALRSLTPELLQQKLHVFAPQPAIAHETAQTPGTRFPGQGEFRGQTRTRGVLVDLVVNAPELAHPDAKVEKTRVKPKPPADEKKDDKDAAKDKKVEDPKDKVTVEVRDAAGTLVRTFRQDVHLGLNRIVWRFERDGGPGPGRDFQEEPELPYPGREVLPGDYTLTIRFQGEAREVKATVLPDPRVAIALADRQAKDALRAQRQQMQADLHRATQRLARCKRDLDVVEKRLAVEPKAKAGADDPHKALRDALTEVRKAFDAVEVSLWGQKPVQGINRDDEGLMAQIQQLARVSGTDDAPNRTETESMARAAAKVPAVAAAVDAFVAGPLATFRKAVEASGLGLVPSLDPVPAGAR
ncbi:MAG: hypothetical protein JNK15_04940 [Planctomycetes bacterium]|nr:hypothetical protein [Planctomycetota bacterium]